MGKRGIRHPLLPGQWLGSASVITMREGELVALITQIRAPILGHEFSR